MSGWRPTMSLSMARITAESSQIRTRIGIGGRRA
jgi:hypothetical protein